MGASVAAFVEEPSKLASTVLLRKGKRKFHILLMDYFVSCCGMWFCGL